MILLNNTVLLQFRFFVHFVSQFITAIMHIKPYMHFFFFCKCSIAEKRNLLMKNGSGGSSKTTIHIAVANFTIALRTRRYIEV